jgi:peptidyl-prolyl cis-trans isomerase C
MNRLPATLGAVAIAILAAACAQKNGDSADAKKSDSVAVVDGYPISRAMYDEYVNTVSNGAANLTAEQRAGLLENLIRGQLLAKQADVSGAAREEKTRAALELQRLNIMSQAATAKFLEDKKPTDAELRAEYDQRLATMEKKQYRASHILVKSEDEARSIIAQLNAGGNFAAIARAKSLDTVSKEKGGDLEWFAPGSMTPEFANAITSLGKGGTSAGPVKTEYGYHVIRVTDIRDTVAPTFESVKDQMAQIVDAKKVKEWVEELTKKSKITKSL